MLDTLNAIAPVFLIIVIGHLLFRSKLVGEETWSAIEHLCFYLLFPLLIIRTLSRANLGDVPVFDFILTLVVAILGMVALLIGSRLLFARQMDISGPIFSSLFQGAARFHGFIALAIVASLYGDDGVTLTAIALGVMVPLMNVICVIVLSIYGQNDIKPDIRSIVLQVLKNPLIGACIVGLLFNLTGIPDIVFSTVEIIGDGGLGLALLIVGAGMRPGHAAANKMLVSVGVIIRLIGMPLLVVGMCWLIGLDGLPRTVAIIAGAVPSASSSYVMARKMGGDATLMSSILTFQVLASFITLPLFIYLAGIP
ncbi:MAG: malonate transporter [Parasphingorhabdus sp.]